MARRLLAFVLDFSTDTDYALCDREEGLPAFQAEVADGESLCALISKMSETVLSIWQHLRRTCCALRSSKQHKLLLLILLRGCSLLGLLPRPETDINV